MTFTEKLTRITEDRNRCAVARRARLPTNAINDYINKKYRPRADTAVKIARALNVSIAWLVDDSMGWPPIWANSPESDRQDAAKASDSLAVRT